jgi:hypothetical protein
MREEDVGDGDVHLGDPQSNQVLDLPYDVAAHGLGYPVDDPTVLDEFKEDLEEIKQKADQAELPPPAEGRLRYRAAADWRISLTDLAKKDPPGAILVAWGFVEEELAELADRLNLFPIPLPRQRSPLRISRKLSAVGALSDEMFGLIDSLRLLSKSVANAPAPRMLAAEALEYIEVAQRVVEQLRALPTSSGESEK